MCITYLCQSAFMHTATQCLIMILAKYKNSLISNYNYTQTSQNRVTSNFGGRKLIQINLYIIQAASLMSDPSNTQPPTVRRWNLPMVTNKGPWNREECQLFQQGIRRFGKNVQKWKEIAQLVRTRDQVQVRSHAQKYFNHLENLKKRIENQVLPQSRMNNSQKTRSTVNLEEQKDEMELEEEDNPVSVQLQGQKVEQSIATKTKKISKSSKLNKKMKIHDKKGQDRQEEKPIEATYPNSEVNDAQVNMNEEIAQTNNISAKKRTPSKLKNKQRNNKSKKSNGKHLPETAKSAKKQPWKKTFRPYTKDNIIIIPNPYFDDFYHQDMTENIHSNTTSLGSASGCFKVSKHSAFKPFISRLK